MEAVRADQDLPAGPAPEPDLRAEQGRARPDRRHPHCRLRAADNRRLEGAVELRRRDRGGDLHPRHPAAAVQAAGGLRDHTGSLHAERKALPVNNRLAGWLAEDFADEEEESAAEEEESDDQKFPAVVGAAQVITAGLFFNKKNYKKHENRHFAWLSVHSHSLNSSARYSL